LRVSSLQACELVERMTKEAVLLAGLPGCGKTTHLCQMCRNGWLVFDDYKAQAFEDCSKFARSLKFLPLITALHAGVKCVAADIDFCATDARNEAEVVLRAGVPGLDLKWEFFANDRSACEANIRTRNRPSLQRELECLAKYSPSYTIPEGAVVLPVWAET
jgi:hypothetical protein